MFCKIANMTDCTCNDYQVLNTKLKKLQTYLLERMMTLANIMTINMIIICQNQSLAIIAILTLVLTGLVYFRLTPRIESSNTFAKKVASLQKLTTTSPTASDITKIRTIIRTHFRTHFRTK